MNKIIIFLIDAFQPINNYALTLIFCTYKICQNTKMSKYCTIWQYF